MRQAIRRQPEIRDFDPHPIVIGESPRVSWVTPAMYALSLALLVLVIIAAVLYAAAGGT